MSESVYLCPHCDADLRKGGIYMAQKLDFEYLEEHDIFLYNECGTESLDDYHGILFCTTCDGCLDEEEIEDYLGHRKRSFYDEHGYDYDKKITD